MQRNVEKCREMQKNAEKFSEMQINAEKFSEMQINAEKMYKYLFAKNTCRPSKTSRLPLINNWCQDFLEDLSTMPAFWVHMVPQPLPNLQFKIIALGKSRLLSLSKLGPVPTQPSLILSLKVRRMQMRIVKLMA